MLKKIMFLLAFATCFTFTKAQEIDHMLLGLKVDIVYLSSDIMEGRSTGTPGAALAREYIASRFAEIGLKPKGSENSFFHPFNFKYKPNPHSDEGVEDRTGYNVVGLLDNGAETTVVIGAHYDHLGYGDFGSLHTGEPAIHNGADDNASGVAGILALADHLKKSDDKANNYLFIAFSGEEMGLFGSKNFAKTPTIDLEKVNYMLNLDMVGRLNEEKVVVINGVGTSPAWNSTFPEIESDISIKTTDSGVGPSDHTSFYLKDIPSLHFFTGQHSDYHKPSDDCELINYEGLQEVVEYVASLIDKLDDDGKIEFTKTKDEQKGRRAASFKVTLGVMPDYTYQGEGMKIDGVSDGRPAANAGLEGGDVIIKIGDHDVKDIYDYMNCLANYKLGDNTRVAFIREDKVIVKNVTF